MSYSEADVALCIGCRGYGHRYQDCDVENVYDWEWSDERRRFRIAANATQLCQRCIGLDVLGLFRAIPPWSTQDELAWSVLDHPDHYRKLGDAGSVLFSRSCPLCQCLFAITPTPGHRDQSILLTVSWNIFRLEGSVAVDTGDKRKSQKCLLIGLYHPERERELSLTTGDALTLLQRTLPGPGAPSLCGRRINPQTLDIDMIEKWVARCRKLHHLNCHSVQSSHLQGIRLFDIYSRSVVSYPGEYCSYIALSYVWGDVPQPAVGLGPVNGRLPRSIEDACQFADALGIQYLWCDSLCIDQADDRVKLTQIGLMNWIYRGSYLTIVAMSGVSAESALSRVCGNGEQMFPQLTCRVEDETLVSIMPTLSQQVWSTKWGSRAWTLQEAALSPRCLYVSDQQLYFECNGMSCTEALDESDCWVHKIRHNYDLVKDGFQDALVGAGVLRTPMAPQRDKLQTIRVHYGVLMTLYAYREMTHDSDSIAAFQGMLQHLDLLGWTKGFHWGHPLDDLNWSLLWISRHSPRRRAGFPTWSFGGWDCYKWPHDMNDVRSPHDDDPPLRIWTIDKSGSKAQFLFETGTAGDDGSHMPKTLHRLYPGLTTNKLSEEAIAKFSLPSQHDLTHILCIEGIVLQFNSDGKPSSENSQQVDAFRQFIHYDDVECSYPIDEASQNAMDGSEVGNVEQNFLILCQSVQNDVVNFMCLLLDYRGTNTQEGASIAYRKIPACIQVPLGKIQNFEAICKFTWRTTFLA